MNAALTSYVAEKRAAGVPWPHIANMAGCCEDDLGVYRLAEACGVRAAAPPSTKTPRPLSEPIFEEDAPPGRQRREPGGLLLAVLYAVGDGYSTSLKIAGLLDTSIDNVNGALGRLEVAAHVCRASDPLVSPVVWMATDQGMKHLRAQLYEGFE